MSASKTDVCLNTVVSTSRQMSNNVLSEWDARILSEFVRRTGCEPSRAIEILRQARFDLNVRRAICFFFCFLPDLCVFSLTPLVETFRLHWQFMRHQTMRQNRDLHPLSIALNGPPSHGDLAT